MVENGVFPLYMPLLRSLSVPVNAASTNMSLLRSFAGATATLKAEVLLRYPEFSSMADLPALRWGERARQTGLLGGAVGNNTPAGKQLTNIRKLVTGGGSGSSSSSGCSSSSSSSSS